MQTSQSARVGRVHQTPYAMPGKENMPVDRGPAESKTLTVDFSQEVKDRFTGHELITWEDGQITGILRPPRKPIFTDTKKLERMIAQAEHKIKNVHFPEIEKLKTKNHYSDMERVQKIVDQSRANIKAWETEITTAEQAEKDYQDAVKEINSKIRAAVK
jgi:hypothetical protein